MEIEVVDELIVPATNKDRTIMFQKIQGIIFCKSCGKDYREFEIINNTCPICKGTQFIKGEFASALAGYLKLNRDDPKALRDYYRCRTKTSSRISMNTKRIIIWLLIMDGFFTAGDKKTEDEVRTALWKKW